MTVPAQASTRPISAGIEEERALLAEAEGSPIEWVNRGGKAAFFLICEHASNRIPASLANLGLGPEVLQSHVAWDPGAAEVAKAMAVTLDAPLILQRFSRLVYDCNRPPDSPSAMPAKSEIYDIPGNQALTGIARASRIAALYTPFHSAIEQHLDQAIKQEHPPVIITVHSFTPVFHGRPRAVQLGLLHDRDDRLARVMLGLSDDRDGDIRLNQPYAPTDGVMHMIQRHALPRDLPNVMIEIRNDLIHEEKGQRRLAASLAGLVTKAVAHLR